MIQPTDRAAANAVRTVRPGVDRLEPRTLPATFIANSLLDEPDADPGDGFARAANGATTLRAAIMEANALPGADFIVLPAGVFQLNIAGVPGENSAAEGDLDVVGAISIRGAGRGQTVIVGNGSARLFDFDEAGDVTLNGLTLQGGRDSDGGAIRIRGDTALKLLASTLHDNRAGQSGGAVHANAGAGPVMIVDCFFESNVAVESGGALHAINRELCVMGSTFAENVADRGGAAAAFGGNWIVARSTFSGNRAFDRGGAIDGVDSVAFFLSDSTITDNRAERGGGAATDYAIELVNTILAGNLASMGVDGWGSFESLGHNLFGSPAGIAGILDPTDRVGTVDHRLDPLLTALSFFGGLTPTRVPLPGSPALDVGLPKDAIDQRGIARSAHRPDIGAVEARTFKYSKLGSADSARVGTPYGRLSVRLMEGDVGLPGVVVSFLAPTTGPGGSFAGPATAITDADGVATSPVFLANAQAGAFQVRASLAAGLALEFNLQNHPAAADRIDVQAPAAVRAGESFVVSLTIRDAFGNVIFDFNKPIAITSSDPYAILDSQLIQVQAFENGTAQFLGTLKTAGTQTIRFSSGGLEAKATLQVLPAAATAIELAVGPQLRAGTSSPLTTTLRDEFGNVATEFTGPVSVTSTDANATLPASVNFTAADRGVKTVAATFRTAGPQSIHATVAGAHADANVTIVPAAATRFELNGPTVATAGEPILLTVTARDAFGNVVTGFRGRLNFLSDDPQATLPANQSFGSNDAGVKLLTLTFRTTGPRSVTFGAGGLQATYRVAITPAALDRFTASAPTSVNQHSPFAITLTARDAFGNVATNYTGTVNLTSNDGRAVLPGPVTFTAANAGVRTVGGLALRTPGNRTLSLRDSAGTVQVDAAIAVRNLGPVGLTLTPGATNINEGDSLTLNGTFTNVDADETHTVVIRWGDGSPDTMLTLAAGETTFSAGHVYADNLSNAGIRVLVTDADGASAEANAAVTVANVAPAISVPTALRGSDVGRIGEPFAVSGTFGDPGEDTFTATVDYGDGQGPQPLILSADRRFNLRHVYTEEGTYTVVVNVMDDEGGRASFSERVAVLLPGTANVRVVVIGPGVVGTINTSTYDVEFINASTNRPAVFLAALVDVAAIGDLPGSPQVGPGGRLIAVDFRVLDADPNSKLTIVLHYEPTGVTPELMYFDTEAGEFRQVRGSTRFADSFVIDKERHTVTVTLDGSTSSPTLARLNGTLFTLTVPAPAAPIPAPPPAPRPAPQQAFFVQANTPTVRTPSDIGGLLRPTAAITGLASGGEVTLTLSTSDGLRRGGSDSEGHSPIETSLLPVMQLMRKIMVVRSALAEAIRMWLDHPAPMEAPALVPPPPKDDVWQVSLDIPAAAQHEDAPAELEAVPLDERTLLIDASAAVADHRPWWLADAAPAAPVDGQEPIALPQITSEPTDEERAAAAVAAIWLGGHALAISAPEVPAEDRGRDPLRKTRPKLRVRKEDE